MTDSLSAPRLKSQMPSLWEGFKVFFLSAPWILGIELLSSPSRAFACDQELPVHWLGVKKGLVPEHTAAPAAVHKNCQGGDFRRADETSHPPHTHFHMGES